MDDYIVAALRPFWLISIDDGAEIVCPVTDGALVDSLALSVESRKT